MRTINYTEFPSFMKCKYVNIKIVDGVKKSNIKLASIFINAKNIYETLLLQGIEITWSDACKQAWHNAKEEKKRIQKVLNNCKHTKSSVSGGDFSSDKHFSGVNYKNVM